MFSGLLALFGFAGHETQGRVPPLLGFFFVVAPIGYLTARGMLSLTTLAGAYGIWVETIATVALVLIVQGLLRALIFRDEYSWIGWFRKAMREAGILQ